MAFSPGRTSREGVACSIPTLIAHSRATGYLGGLERGLPDGVHAHHGHSVAGDNLVREVAVAVELHVPRQLSLRNRIGTLLQLQHLQGPTATVHTIFSTHGCCSHLKVNTLAFVRDDEEGVHRTLGPPSLLPARGGGGVGGGSGHCTRPSASGESWTHVLHLRGRE